MLMAERLILLAVKVMPDNHPHATIMARHLNAMASETHSELVADRTKG